MSIDADRTPAWLRRLRIDKVSLVDKGANAHSTISFFKREDTDMTTTATSQTVIFHELRKRAVEKYPDEPEYAAIDRFVTEVPEGQELARRHSEAIVDYEPQGTVEKVDFIGGNDAQAIAKSLDDAAVTYSRTHNVGMEAAYDRVLETTEGQQLRERYDKLVRS